MMRNQLKTFVKVGRLNPIFREKNVSLEARELYRSLAEEINLDGYKILISNRHIQELLDISVRVRQRLIKELTDKEFISIEKTNGGENIYLLLIGVFKGREDKPFTSHKINIQYNGMTLSYPEKEGSPSKQTTPVSVKGTPNVLASETLRDHAHAYIITNPSPVNNKLKEHDKEKHMSAFFNSLTFSKNSPFKSLPNFRFFINKFGLAKVQETITFLEKQYEYKPQPPIPGGLLHEALKFEWNLEESRLNEAKEREVAWEKEKEVERKLYLNSNLDNYTQEEDKSSQYEQDYLNAKQHPELFINAKELLELEGVKIKESNPFSEMKLKGRVIELYRKFHN